MCNRNLMWEWSSGHCRAFCIFFHTGGHWTWASMLWYLLYGSPTDLTPIVCTIILHLFSNIFIGSYILNTLSIRMDHYSLITRRPKEGVPSSRVWTYIYQNQAGAVLATLGIFPGSPRYSGRSASTTQNTQGYQTGADCFCTLRVPATQNPWGNSYNMVLDGWMPLTMGLLLKLDTQSHTWVLHSRLWHIKAWLSIISYWFQLNYA